MSPPRYLLLTELFLPTKGGTAVWFAEAYRRMAGKEIHIVTRDVPGATEIDAQHPNTIHRLALERRWWLRPESLAMYLKLFLRSLGIALTHRLDAVHAGRVLPEGLPAWVVARLTLRPFLVYAHGEELTSWGRGLKYKTMVFVFRRADRIIANSEWTRDELVRMGVAADRITLIYPGVDVDRYRPGLPCDDLRASIGMQAGDRLILTVGRLSRRKGFDQVIRSLPLLAARGIRARVALIGIGEDQDYLRGVARECGVADRVHLLGHVAMDDLPRWYNACDVFAMPNREIDGDTEGFGLVYLEAAACGKPSVAGLAGGTGAAVPDGVTGLRIDGTTPEAVAEGLARILGDAEFARRLGEAGLARVRKEFSWESIAARTVPLTPPRDSL